MNNFSIFRFLYISFVVLGIYYAILKMDFIEASSLFGIALAFDPFDQKQSWKNRPAWQKKLVSNSFNNYCAFVWLWCGVYR